MKVFVVLSNPDPKGGSFVKAVSLDEPTAMVKVRELNKEKPGHWYQENNTIGTLHMPGRMVIVRKTSIRKGGIGAWIYTYTLKFGTSEAYPYIMEMTDEGYGYIETAFKLAGYTVDFRDENAMKWSMLEYHSSLVRDGYSSMGDKDQWTEVQTRAYEDMIVGHSRYHFMHKDGSCTVTCPQAKVYFFTLKKENQ